MPNRLMRAIAALARPLAPRAPARDRHPVPQELTQDEIAAVAGGLGLKAPPLTRVNTDAPEVGHR